MSQEEVELVRTATERMSRGWDVRILQAGVEQGIIAPDVELVPAPELARDTVHRGLTEIDEFMRGWTEDFDDWSVEIDRVIDAGGGRVVTLLTQSGTGKASGVPVDLFQGMVWELQNGKVVRMRLFADPGQALAFAGVTD
jgi:ketosteroid isomerase-like protein